MIGLGLQGSKWGRTYYTQSCVYFKRFRQQWHKARHNLSGLAQTCLRLLKTKLVWEKMSESKIGLWEAS